MVESVWPTGGTWSTPPAAHGWQRNTRRAASHEPRIGAVRLHRFERVRRARRVIAAHLPIQRADGKPIRAQQRHEHGLHQRTSPRATPTSRSASRPTAGASPAVRKGPDDDPATEPAVDRRDRASGGEAAASPDCARRATPTARLTTKPTAGGRHVSSPGSTCTTRCVRPALAPWRTVVREVLAVAHAMDRGQQGRLRQTASRVLCAGDCAKMARPARVRMRRRKPCLRARRRLLGWYVRLLTSGSSRRGWSHLRRSLPRSRIGLPIHGSDAEVGERDCRRPPLVHRSTSCEHAADVAKTDVHNGTGGLVTGQTDAPTRSAQLRVQPTRRVRAHSVCAKRLLWSGDAASVRAVFGLFHSSAPGGSS